MDTNAKRFFNQYNLPLPGEGDQDPNRALARLIIERLAGAMGGYSQVPDEVVGMAIAGQHKNGLLGYADNPFNVDEVLRHAADLIYERWEEYIDEPPTFSIKEGFDSASRSLQV